MIIEKVKKEDFILDNIEKFIVARIDENIVGFLWFSTEYPKDMLVYTELKEDINNCIYCEWMAVKREFQGRILEKDYMDF